MNIYDRQQLRERLVDQMSEGSTHWEGCATEHPICAALNLLDEVTEMENHYSAALDEVYLLRVQMEYEAGVREADLGLKTYPKSRRRFAEEAISRMWEAAEGKIGKVSRERNENGGPTYRRMLGAKTLTRSQWESRNDA